MSGGNTDEFYEKEGTLNKSQMLVDMNPDITKLVERWGRWHHWVNYKKFKFNKVIRKKDICVTNKINNYGMVLRRRDEKPV